MFFMMGISSGRKDLGTIPMNICASCGAYGRLDVFVTFTQLLLFFIPCFKWNKKYYARSTCCQTLFELDPVKGRQMERGEEVHLEPGDLSVCREGFYGLGRQTCYVCDNCGYSTSENFTYCPKCGSRLRRSQEDNYV